VRIPILVSEEGVSAKIFGMTLKRIDWAYVHEIRKIQSGFGLVDAIQIFNRKPRLPCAIFFNLCGPIVFTQRISEYQDLLDRVNRHAQQHRIPLFFMDQKVAAL
jgi:hypothetical protein